MFDLSLRREMTGARVLLDGTAFVPGIYPRSESLVQATRDLARGRTTEPAVEAHRQEDRRRLLAVQRESGLMPFADGMLDWQDMFRPFVDASDGLVVGTLVRFLDSNTFYRALDVDGTPRLRTPLATPELPEPWVGTLPSPFALAHAVAHVLGADALAETLLAPQVEAWAAAGCALVVLAEPFLPREPQRIDELLAALERLPGHVPCALQLPFADAAPLLAPLADARVDAVGVDLHATTLEAVPEGYPKPVLAGVVDATGSLLEEPLALAGTVRALRERCPAGVALTPNGDLQHVPEPIAREKLRRLGAAAAMLRGASS